MNQNFEAQGFTVDDSIKAHKQPWEHWTYFSEPRRVWRNKDDILCIQHVDKGDLSAEYYHYVKVNNKIKWF